MVKRDRERQEGKHKHNEESGEETEGGIQRRARQRREKGGGRGEES